MITHPKEVTAKWIRDQMTVHRVRLKDMVSDFGIDNCTAHLITK